MPQTRAKAKSKRVTKRKNRDLPVEKVLVPTISDIEFPRHESLSTNQVRAAYYLAEGRLTVSKIAMEVKVSDKTVYQWAKIPAFQEQIQEYKDLIQSLFTNRSLTIKANRVAQLEHHFEDIQTIKLERGASSDMQNVPGGKTGLLGREVKYYGKNADVAVTIYEFDGALDRAYRDTLKDIAREMGDINDVPTNATGPTINGDVTINQQQNNVSVEHRRETLLQFFDSLRSSGGGNAARSDSVEVSVVPGHNGTNGSGKTGTG